MITFTTAPGALPPGQRIYAIGDIHGCADRLRALHGIIARDLAARPVAAATLVHVGDYVDRGPDSAGVVEILANPSLPMASVVNLMGNHEQMMLLALTHADKRFAAHWLENGGAAALASWGIEPSRRLSEWADGVPAAHLAFLRGLKKTHRAGDFLFVHAGIRPGLPIAFQDPEDLLWMREPFLSWEGDLGAIVVHGHTPTKEPVVRPNRIGIDTGAVLGGPLTCAVLEADRLGFLHA
jgi:serine/threonine protein phosphatase 1